VQFINKAVDMIGEGHVIDLRLDFMKLFAELHHLMWAVVLYHFELVAKEVSSHGHIFIFPDECITKIFPGWVYTFLVDNEVVSEVSSTMSQGKVDRCDFFRFSHMVQQEVM